MRLDGTTAGRPSPHVLPPVQFCECPRLPCYPMLKLDLISAEHKVESRYESRRQGPALTPLVKAFLTSSQRTDVTSKIFPAPLNNSNRLESTTGTNHNSRPCLLGAWSHPLSLSSLKAPRHLHASYKGLQGRACFSRCRAAALYITRE